MKVSTHGDIFDNPLNEKVFIKAGPRRDAGQRCLVDAKQMAGGGNEGGKKRTLDKNGSGFASGAAGEFRRPVVFTF